MDRIEPTGLLMIIDSRGRRILLDIATAATLLLSASCVKDATNGPAPSTTGSVAAPQTNGSPASGANGQMGSRQMGSAQIGPGPMGSGQMGSGPGPNDRMGSGMQNYPAMRDGGHMR